MALCWGSDEIWEVMTTYHQLSVISSCWLNEFLVGVLSIAWRGFTVYIYQQSLIILVILLFEANSLSELVDTFILLSTW